MQEGLTYQNYSNKRFRNWHRRSQRNQKLRPKRCNPHLSKLTEDSRLGSVDHTKITPEEYRELLQEVIREQRMTNLKHCKAWLASVNRVEQSLEGLINQNYSKKLIINSSSRSQKNIKNSRSHWSELTGDNPLRRGWCTKITRIKVSASHPGGHERSQNNI